MKEMKNKAAPAAVAVPDDIRAALSASVEQIEHDALKIEMEWGMGRNLYGMEIDGDLPPALLQARAALAATPAKKSNSAEFDGIKTSAPVVLPETTVDWSNAPKWAQYVAMDSSGEWWWHLNKPYQICGRWEVDGAESELAESEPIAIDWKCTLMKRPQKAGKQNRSGIFKRIKTWINSRYDAIAAAKGE